MWLHQLVGRDLYYLVRGTIIQNKIQNSYTNPIGLSLCDRPFILLSKHQTTNQRLSTPILLANNVNTNDKKQWKYESTLYNAQPPPTTTWVPPISITFELHYLPAHSEFSYCLSPLTLEFTVKVIELYWLLYQYSIHLAANQSIITELNKQWMQL